MSTAPLSLIVNLSAISYLEVLYGCRNSGELNNASRMVVDLFAKVLPLTENISETAIAATVRTMIPFENTRR